MGSVSFTLLPSYSNSSFSSQTVTSDEPDGDMPVLEDVVDSDDDKNEKIVITTSDTSSKNSSLCISLLR